LRQADTSLGGHEKAFPQTTQGILARFRVGNGGDYRAGVELLAQRYWKPVYAYIRAKWARSNDDAKDLTQAFFLVLLEDDALERFKPELGSFRRYLKVILQRFLGHQDRALARLKRGGAVRILSLDGDDQALRDIVPDSQAAEPDKVFERAWTVEVLKRATERTREHFRSTNQDDAFRIYEEYVLPPPSGRPTYSELAARYGIKEREVETLLTLVRMKMREEILHELADLTADDHHLREEWDALFEG
jgi:RNA polymerase sigma factor (sigma-70 family)